MSEVRTILLPEAVRTTIATQAQARANAAPSVLLPEDEKDFLAQFPDALLVEAEHEWNGMAERAKARLEEAERQRRTSGSASKPAAKATAGAAPSVSEPPKSSRPLLQGKLTVEQAAQLVGLGKTNLRAVALKGEIPVVRFGAKILFVEKDLEDFVRRHYGRMGEDTVIHRTASPALPEHIRNSPLLKKRCA